MYKKETKSETAFLGQKVWKLMFNIVILPTEFQEDCV